MPTTVSRVYNSNSNRFNHEPRQRRRVVSALSTHAPATELNALNAYFGSECKGNSCIEVQRADSGAWGCIATRDISNDQDLCTIPQAAAVTAVDAAKHPLIGEYASQRSELVALTLWLMAERSLQSSRMTAFVQALPTTTQSPVLWPESFRRTELKGSPILDEARDREVQIREEWASITEQASSSGSGLTDLPQFTEESFMNTFCVVVAHAIYLPSAQCFALLPYVSLMGRTGNDNGCDVDYNAEREVVVVKAARPFRKGAQVLLNDPRPSGELLLATGAIQEENLSDFLTFETSLVPSDRLYSTKRDVLSSQGMSDKETFPLYRERFPIQLLNYLRFSRIQDVGVMAKVSFETDAIVSPQNEYEVLQLVMGDLRERLQEYLDNVEEDVKLLQDPNLDERERIACMLRKSEKDILMSTTDAIRQRLAPIRGIPTKSGKMEDPNADLLEIFDTIEGIGSAPQRAWSSFARWASGKDDPDWKR